MKILVTGADSQIGTELREVLEQRLGNVAQYMSSSDAKLTDSEATRQLMEHGRFTHVVNCYEYADIDRAEEESGMCAAMNADSVRNLAMHSDIYGYKIIQLSTDFVFDGCACRPYGESDKVNPISQYGATKRKAETSLLALAPDSVIVRTGWHFSPFGKNFVRNILDKANRERVISVVSDQIGCPTYSLDLANAIVTILTAQQWVSGFFNFCDEGVASRYDFAKAIMRLTGNRQCDILPIPATDYPTLAPRPYYSVLNTQRIKATYGIKIPHWEESLQHCLQRMGMAHHSHL